MKEILVDLYKIKQIYTGLGQFSLYFAKELMLQAPEDIKIHFLIPKNFTLETDRDIELVRVNYQKRYLAFFTRNYSIWHSLNQFPSHFPNKRTIQILTVHDLNFLIEKSKAKGLQYLKALQKNIDRADYITSISYNTKKILEENINLSGKKVRVIYNGISVNETIDTIKPKYVGRSKFFFSIGKFTRKKNFHVLLPLMKHFEDFQLILAGDNKTSYGSEIKAQIDSLNLKDKVILPGMISDSDKYWLYSNCEAFLFPSLAEGFAMPVIEAMRFGKPVFLSNIEVLHEIGSDKAYYFDCFDDTFMSSFINQKLSLFYNDQINLVKAIKEYARKFDWSISMGEYISLYKEILGNQ
jgi:glycosyltransferase involved in cell wall biosynthesis